MRGLTRWWGTQSWWRKWWYHSIVWRQACWCSWRAWGQRSRRWRLLRRRNKTAMLLWRLRRNDVRSDWGRTAIANCKESKLENRRGNEEPVPRPPASPPLLPASSLRPKIPPSCCCCCSSSSSSSSSSSFPLLLLLPLLLLVLLVLFLFFIVSKSAAPRLPPSRQERREISVSTCVRVHSGVDASSLASSLSSKQNRTHQKAKHPSSKGQIPGSIPTPLTPHPSFRRGYSFVARIFLPQKYGHR